MQKQSSTHTVFDQQGRPIEVDSKQFRESIVSDHSQPAQLGAQTPINTTAQPNVVWMARPHDPKAPYISEAVRSKHEESKKQYPYLNLSEGEYVISAVKRHPIGLMAIWGVVAIIIALAIFGIFAIMGARGGILDGVIAEESLPSLALMLLGLIVLFFVGGLFATQVYEGNRFFLTNESVTQHIQTSLFSRKEQTVSLANIEDASFRQHGILQSLLNYGSIRLSTEGDETTYRFNLVENPGNQIAILNNAVESFKNGRPIDISED